MNRKNFSIPVAWSEPDHAGKVGGLLRLNSNTLVLSVPPKFEGVFEVERVPGSWSPHIPEKRPKYKICWDDARHLWTGGVGRLRPRWRGGIEREPVRLHQLAIGQDFLVPLTTRRRQQCINHNGYMHGIYTCRTGMSPITFCGESVYLAINDRADEKFQDVEPTCKPCLAYKSVWCCFTILPYDDIRVVNKRTIKERTAIERHLALPTAYARVLDDDIFENPTYRPIRLPKTRPEHDPLDDEFVDPRDRKRETALDRTRRLEEAKAAVQGHRRR